MLQLEVNISSSQGFSLVNHPSTPNISAKILVLLMIFLLSVLHCSRCSIFSPCFMISIELFNLSTLTVAHTDP